MMHSYGLYSNSSVDSVFQWNQRIKHYHKLYVSTIEDNSDTFML